MFRSIIMMNAGRAAKSPSVTMPIRRPDESTTRSEPTLASTGAEPQDVACGSCVPAGCPNHTARFPEATALEGLEPTFGHGRMGLFVTYYDRESSAGSSPDRWRAGNRAIRSTSAAVAHLAQ